MNINAYFFLISVGLSWPSLIYAAGKVGNGGDVRVCRNDKKEVTEIELFDYYEARTKAKKLQLNISLGDDNLSVEEKVMIALNRFEKHLPNLAKEFKKRAHDILDEKSRVAVFMDDIFLEDIPDTDSRYWPLNCKVEQIAVRETPKIEGHPFFMFNKDLWDAFERFPGGKDQQAGLILHEVIYELYVSFGENNSTRARFINAFISSDKLDRSLSEEANLDIWTWFQDVYPEVDRFTQINSERYNFKMFGLRFKSVKNVSLNKGGDFAESGEYSGKVYFPPYKENIEAEDQYVEVQGKRYAVSPGAYSTEWDRHRGYLWVAEGSKVEFYASGALKSFTPKEKSRFKVGDREIETKLQVHFYENGSVSKIDPYVVTEWKVRDDILKFSTMFFDKEGNLRQGHLYGSQDVTVHGKKLRMSGRSGSGASNVEVWFYDNGILKQGYLVAPGAVWNDKEKKWIIVESPGELGAVRFGEPRTHYSTTIYLERTGFFGSAVYYYTVGQWEIVK